MAFVNEYVSDEDVKKYELESICKKYRVVRALYDWTVDRDRDMYLMWIRAGREDFSDCDEFVMYWHNALIHAQLRRRGGGTRGASGWTEWSLLRLDLPEHLSDKRATVLQDLKEALTTYREFGVSSTTTQHTATFNF